MLAYLLDTDICIHVLKHRDRRLAERFKAGDGRAALHAGQIRAGLERKGQTIGA